MSRKVNVQDKEEPMRAWKKVARRRGLTLP